MTAEQKPGCGICFRHPREALTALKAKGIIELTREGAGTSRVLRTTPQILAREGYSIPEITAELVKRQQPKKQITLITEASQMEDSSL